MNMLDVTKDTRNRDGLRLKATGGRGSGSLRGVGKTIRKSTEGREDDSSTRRLQDTWGGLGRCCQVEQTQDAAGGQEGRALRVGEASEIYCVCVCVTGCLWECSGVQWVKDRERERDRDIKEREREREREGERYPGRNDQGERERERERSERKRERER